MHKEKILILFIVCSFFLATTLAVAADETITLYDEKDDVIYYDELTGEEIETDQKPNIDIRELTYSRTGQRITLSLTVEGIIENRGSLDAFLTGDTLEHDLVLYSIMLSTTEDMYTIIYVNNVCNYSDLDASSNITDFTVQNSILTVSFDLKNDTEVYESIIGMTMDIKISATEYELYSDEINDFPLEIEAGDSYSGKVGEEIEFFVFAMGGTSPHTYEWDFGDGTTSNEQYPIHSYTEAKTYTATVTVTDRNGISETATATVTITGAPTNGNGDPATNNLFIFGLIILFIVIIGVIIVIVVLRRR